MIRCLKGLLLFSLISIFYEADINGQENATRNTTKHVLYVNSYDLNYSWSHRVTKGVTRILTKRKDIRLFTEFLDTKNFDQQNFEKQYDLLKQKYAKTPIDIIIAADNNALEFLNRYQDLFPGIPVTFCGIDESLSFDLECTNYYGYKEGVSFEHSLNTIKSLLPATKTFYIICDNSKRGTELLNEAKRYEDKQNGTNEFKYYHAVSLDSLKKVFPRFEKDGVVALFFYRQTPDGRSIDEKILLKRLIQTSSVPVFKNNGRFLGTGILGGTFNGARSHGVHAAILALLMLDSTGYTPDKHLNTITTNFHADYNVLKKFNIKQKLLPEESIIKNKPKYRYFKLIKIIVLLILLVGIQAVIMTILYRNYFLRKQAEKKLIENYSLIRQQNLELEESSEKVEVMNGLLEEKNKHLLKSVEELEKARKKAVESDKLKSSFLANLSHEIRTPLNAIIGFSSILEEEKVYQKENKLYIETVKENGLQLLQIFEDILFISITDTSELNLFFASSSVVEIMKDLEIYFVKNRNTDIQLEFVYNQHDQKKLITTDLHRLNQVITHLIFNAIKFTPKGKVTIGYYDNQEKFVFYIKDTGIGIDPEVGDAIFNQFWKTEVINNNLNPGIGLGLSICRSISNALNGKIWYTSEPQNGSTFYFELPFSNSKIKLNLNQN
jgi:signal transduction histidine kinase